MEQFLDSNFANFCWGIAAFILFVVVFFRLTAKHVLAAIDARESQIASQMKEAEDAYVRAKTVQAEVDAKFAAAEGKIAALIDQARKDAEALKNEMLDKGRAEIEALRHRSLRDIDAARNAALLSMRQGIAEISTEMAEKIVRAHLDAGTYEALVAETMTAYAQNHERR